MQIPTHAILIAALAIQGSVAAFEASKTFIAANTPPPIEGTAVGPDKVLAGDTVFVTWQIVKRTDCVGKNSRVWDGQEGFHVTEPERVTALPRSSEVRTYTIPTDVPDLAPLGELSLRIVGYYDCPNAEKTYFELGPVKMNVTEKRP